MWIERPDGNACRRRETADSAISALGSSSELCSAWTSRDPSHMAQVVPTAFLTAALASRRVESSVGSGERIGRDQQRDFGAAQNYRVAALVGQSPDYFLKICQGAWQ